jgi:hypothetical protein
MLSKGWIRIAGHYYSQEAIDTKKMIFPHDYDATKMFWLINKKGAYGARLGLVQVIKEIILGNAKSILKNHFNKKYNNDVIISCNCHEKESCTSTRTNLSRIFNMIKNGDKFTFN